MRGPVNPFTTSLAKGDEDSVLGLSFPNWLAAQMRGKEGEFQDYLVFHVKVWKDKPIVVDKALKKMRSETSRKARLASPPCSSSEASRQDDLAPDHTSAATASLTSPSTSRTSSCSSSMATPAPPKTTPSTSGAKRMRKKQRGQKRKSSLTQRGTPRLRAKPAEETQRVPGFPAR